MVAGLQQLGIEGKFNAASIGEVKLSFRPKTPCLSDNEHRPSGPTPVVIFWCGEF